LWNTIVSGVDLLEYDPVMEAVCTTCCVVFFERCEVFFPHLVAASNYFRILKLKDNVSKIFGERLA
jgi:hypothetical protein